VKFGCIVIWDVANSLMNKLVSWFLFLGITGESEGGDRSSMSFLGHQFDLLNDVIESGRYQKISVAIIVLLFVLILKEIAKSMTKHVLANTSSFP